MAKKKIEKEEEVETERTLIGIMEKITNKDLEESLEKLILGEWNRNPTTDPFYFSDGICNLEIFKEYDKNIDELEIKSIKEKLRNIDWNYPSEAIKIIAVNHLGLIIELEYFNDVLNYVEQEGIEQLTENLNKERFDLEFIKKAILIPLNIIKDYWKMYDKKMVEIQNKKLEQIKQLNATQFSELCLNILKKIIGGSIEKSKEEYLVNLMDSYNLFKGDVKEQQNRQFGEPEEIEIEELEEEFDDEEELEEALEEIEDLEEEEELEEDI